MRLGQTGMRRAESEKTQLSGLAVKASIGIVVIYLYLCGFVFAICVLMSNADTSPEMSLDPIRHPLKSVALIATFALPFLLMTMVGRGGRWTWLGLRLFAGAVAAVGVYATLVPRGLFEGITGTGSLRQGSGLVYALSSIAVLLITAIPGLRQQLADGISASNGG
jgi:hypothetical protein